MAVILVVDDEVGIRELLSEILSDEGYAVDLAENAGAARAAILKHPDLVLLDIWMPDNDGVSLLKEWSSTGKLSMPVIMMSGHATLDTAIEATKFGAVDFLEKPIALSRLISSVKEALEKYSPGKRIGAPREPLTHMAPPRQQPMYPPPGSGVHPFTPPASPQPQSAAPQDYSAQALLAAIDLNAPLREARDEFERIYFHNLLKLKNNSMTKVAASSGLERTHLYRKLRQLGIEVGRAGKAKEKAEETSDE